MITIPRRPRDSKAPSLCWPGRSSADLKIERWTPPVRESWGEGEAAGRIIRGDNLRTLASLEPGSVRLAYLDPPFFSGQRYEYRTRTKDEWFSVPSFEDVWGGDLGAYLSFLEDRLRLVARALSDDGSLYVHLDSAASHYVKVLIDEILGAGSFSRQIVWRIGWVSGFKSKARNWVRNHDVILYYARPGAPFNRRLLPHPDGYERRSGKKGAGRPLEDVWLDIPSIQLKSFSNEKSGWATQKNEELLRRIIEASSDEGDLVIDPFCGAGTTAAAALSIGRRFIVADDSSLAVHLTRRRLLERDTAAPLGEGDSRGFCFTVEGDEAEVAGPVVLERRSSRSGVTVRLMDVPEASGPPNCRWRDRVDGWWISRAADPRTPVFFAHRRLGRKPAPVALESPPLGGISSSEELVVTAMDLAGRSHLGRG